MPTIIPDPGLPPDVPPITTQIMGHTVDAGTEIYSTSLSAIFFGDVEITNNGVIWLDNHQSYLQGWLTGGLEPKIWNHGLIYIHSSAQAELNPYSPYLYNTGSIFVISDTTTARITGWAASNVVVENFGLLAAQGLGLSPDPDQLGNAFTISSEGTLLVTNHASGQILAEAPDLAIAINSSGQPTIINDGLIEANATDPQGASIGIYSAQSGWYPAVITNSGTIRADWAIYGTYQYYNYTWYAAPNPVEQVHNLSGGLIEGRVFLDIGDDQFVNDGTVIGDVDMGPGQDMFSGSGSVSGIVDMGFDNDTYVGSANADRAYGGRDDDNLGGNAGNDMLFGGFGDDNLHGDAGNDALAGEWGDDTITTSGGDYVEGGEDNDRIVLGDYSFAKVDGGTGFDTLVLASGARAFDLSLLVASGRVTGFEAIEMNGDQRVVVHESDVDALSGSAQLRIAATGTDTVNLVGLWVQGANQLIGGALFETYTLNGRTVLVSDAATVSVGASAPVAGDLDAVAVGDPSPYPAAAEFTDPATYVDYFAILSGDFTVDSREIFYSDTVAFYAQRSDWTFTNDGEIYVLNDAFDYAGAIDLVGRMSVVNNGLIHVEALRPYDPADFHFPTFGVRMGNFPELMTFDNHGEIGVYSAPYTAIGVSGGGTFHNDGLIWAISEHGRALGVTNTYASDLDYGQSFFNTGIIYAEGGGLGLQAFFDGDTMLPTTYVAAGVALYGSLTNDGDIIAVLGANADPGLDAIGVYLLKLYGGNAPNGVTNNGTIDGTIAIKFGNEPGDLSQIGHWVTNNGEIFGDIEFQDAEDQYNGANGIMHGTVFGFGGNDVFSGGEFADSFDGGVGNDTLTGGGGIDILIGGPGNDIFRDTRSGLNGDEIGDLAIGDRIIFSDANLASFTFSLSGSTLTFSGGTLSVQTQGKVALVASAAAGGGVQLSVVQIADVRNDFNGDGRSDILWRNVDGTIGDWLANANGTHSSNGASIAGAPTSWAIAGTGDFNGDGRDDILWRSNAGEVGSWTANDNGSHSYNAAAGVTVIPLSWQVEAVGDFNADGKDDILWRNTDGTVGVWAGQAGGSFVANNAAVFNVSTDWQIVGTGDFNGDGRDDILWRHSSGTFADWLANDAGGFTPNGASLVAITSDWHIVGTGDFNGDGRDDILWRHDSGTSANWTANPDGTFSANFASIIVITNDWNVAGTGDYNGDGRDDILWRHDSGTIANWLANTDNSGTFTTNQASFAGIPTVWQVQDPAVLFL